MAGFRSGGEYEKGLDIWMAFDNLIVGASLGIANLFFACSPPGQRNLVAIS
jgi:hypothetical protein